MESCTTSNSRSGSFDVETYSSLDRGRTKLMRLADDATDIVNLGYNILGHFHFSRGHLFDALKAYVSAEDYCSTPQHFLEMCLNAILACIEMGEFSYIASFFSKAEQTLEAPNRIAIAKLQCASALAHLKNKEYKHAASKFLMSGPELGNQYTEVIASQDVATYGGLCALTSFNKTELKNKVINNIIFGNFLEQVPELKEVLNNFYSSSCDSCLQHLENMKASALLDIHLHDHVETLYTGIRRRADAENSSKQIKDVSL
ncbi:hypothetical protein MKW92_036055 [Papaver armeniacum]|nr:hypothetical protein MKW92_036055 [Papaver armeniacum]